MASDIILCISTGSDYRKIPLITESNNSFPVSSTTYVLISQFILLQCSFLWLWINVDFGMTILVLVSPPGGYDSSRSYVCYTWTDKVARGDSLAPLFIFTDRYV